MTPAPCRGAPTPPARAGRKPAVRRARWLVPLLLAGLLALQSLLATERTAAASAPPMASVDGPDRGFVGVPMHFNGSASTGGGLTFTWDFGDGTGAAEATPTHVFATPGMFAVVVTVRDRDGQTARAAMATVIADVAGFAQGLSTTFTALFGRAFTCVRGSQGRMVCAARGRRGTPCLPSPLLRPARCVIVVPTPLTLVPVPAIIRTRVVVRHMVIRRLAGVPQLCVFLSPRRFPCQPLAPVGVGR